MSQENLEVVRRIQDVARAYLLLVASSRVLPCRSATEAGWRKTDAQTSGCPTSRKGVDKRPFRNRSHPRQPEERHHAWTPLDSARSCGLGRAARASPRDSGPGSRPGDPACRRRDRNRAGESALVRRDRIPRLDHPPLTFNQTAPWRPGHGRRPLTDPSAAIPFRRGASMVQTSAISEQEALEAVGLRE